MSNGKQDEPRPEPPNGKVPPEYLAYAGWLLQNPKVLEVWGLVSDLPEIATPGTAVTLDAGAWFLCRVAMPPIAEGDAIISFVPKV